MKKNEMTETRLYEVHLQHRIVEEVELVVRAPDEECALRAAEEHADFASGVEWETTDEESSEALYADVADDQCLARRGKNYDCFELGNNHRKEYE